MSKRLIAAGALVFWVGCGSPVRRPPFFDASIPDASEAVDSGPTADAGEDAGIDAGAPDSGQDAGAFDAGSVDSGVKDGGTIDGGTIDAGATDAGFDAGVMFDAGVQDAGPVMAIRFGASAGKDGLFTTAIANPDLRTVAGWFRLRINVPTGRQLCVWSFEDNPPSQAYQLMVNTFQLNQWESHDRSEGGFLFAPVDLGWWFIAETNRGAGPATALYWKKDGAATLNVTTGNTHPLFPGATRFLIGTDDATGQNEWMDGDIAGVKVWNAELTATELALEAGHFNPVRVANLHAFYPLQSVATMFNDTSGNGRNLIRIVDGGSWSVQPGPQIPY